MKFTFPGEGYRSTFVHQVYDVLVEECDASPHGSDRYNFCVTWPECTEYRFMGGLGFGGKVWANNGRVYVTCYREDETPVRRDMIAAANERLAVIQAGYELDPTAAVAGEADA